MNKDYIITPRGSRTPFLTGKVAFVNGISSDIGKDIARNLAHNGAYVFGTYNSNKEAADGLVREFKGKIRAEKFDCMEPDYEKKVNLLIESAAKWHGALDILVNVSGILLVKPYLYETAAESDRVWRINYFSADLFCHAAIRKMLTFNNGGDIVNISSTGGIRGGGQQEAYCASKAAMINLTRSIAEEFGPRGIKANVLAPGTTDTKALDAFLDRASKELMVKNIPRGRLCLPADISNAVLGILMNDYLTGSEIILGGGKLW